MEAPGTFFNSKTGFRNNIFDDSFENCMTHCANFFKDRSKNLHSQTSQPLSKCCIHLKVSTLIYKKYQHIIAYVTQVGHLNFRYASWAIAFF